ncbi:hypothetical protein L9F63_022849 [Diploptera punctata]|uniref:Uncharacterized protein n=1 Tax=Diploptera punctata TaxID=6984 RepID=A0AAD8EA64_DIPPU|nr:hypothetical protein L9F63_022849 [Diploptera punctata]
MCSLITFIRIVVAIVIFSGLCTGTPSKTMDTLTKHEMVSQQHAANGILELIESPISVNHNAAPREQTTKLQELHDGRKEDTIPRSKVAEELLEKLPHY